MKIAVLFGGDSMERDVSVASAAQVIAALRSRGHQVLAVDAQHGLLSEQDEHKHLTGNIARLPPRDTAESQFPTIIGNTEIGAVDLVFLALHGGNGENGTVQSVLDLAQLPYTGSGRLGSALAWDKDVAKQLFLAAGVPTGEMADGTGRWANGRAAVGLSGDRQTQRTRFNGRVELGRIARWAEASD